MPEIRIDILAQLHKRFMNKTRKDAVDGFRAMGQDAADAMLGEIEKVDPKIRRQMNQTTNSLIQANRAERDWVKTREQRAEATKRAIEVETKLNDALEKRSKLHTTLANLERNHVNARREAIKLQKGLNDLLEETHVIEKELDDLKARRDQRILDAQKATAAGDKDTAKRIRQELLEIRQQILDTNQDLADAEEIIRQQRADLNQTTDEAKTFEKELDEIRKELDGTTRELTSAEEDLNKAKSEGAKLDEEFIRRSESMDTAHRRRIELLHAMRQQLIDKRDEHGPSAFARMRHRLSGPMNVMGGMLTDLPFVPGGKAGAALGIPIVTTLVALLSQATTALTTASQAAWLLPAGLTAAAAGFGTLSIATSGFMDAIKDIRDPEKFAEAIQSLSPNAQQAALSIQNLLPVFDELKNKTQDALFANVGEHIHNLTNRFMPGFQGMTTSIGGSFNQMIGGITDQLLQPENAAQVQNIFDNIAATFDRIVPGVNALVDAFLTIASAGSDFLPDLAKGFSDALVNFSAFIQAKDESGELDQWIQSGIDAVGELARGLWNLGKVIYDTFAVSDVSEFQNTLNDLISTIDLIATGVRGIGAAWNWVMGFVHDIPEAFATAGNAIVTILAEVGRQILNLVGAPLQGIVGLLNSLPLVDIPNQPLGNLVFGDNGPAGEPTNSYMPFGTGGDWTNPWSREAGASPTAPGSPFGPPADAGTDSSGRIPADGKFYKPVQPGTPGSVPIPGTNQWGIEDTSGHVPISTRERANWMPSDGNPFPDAGLGDYPGQFPVPPPPPEDGKKPSEKDKLDQIKSGWNIQDFMPSGPIGTPGYQPTMPMQTGPMMMPSMGPGPLGVKPGLAAIAAFAKQHFGLDLTSGMTGREGETDSHHSTGNAGDFSNGNAPTPQMRAFAEWAAMNLGPAIKELIYTDDQGGVNMYNGQPHTYSAKTAADHRNHVHLALQEQAAMGGLPPLMYGTGGQPYGQPSLGYYNVDQGRVRDAQNRLDRESTDVAEARMHAKALKELGATAEEIRKAEQKVKEEEAQYNDAYLDLIEAQQGTWKKVNNSRSSSGSALEGILPGLDPDFGLGQGLSGLANNLIKFVATMAMAPILGPLAMMAQNSGGGHGLFGIMGAQNIANGMSPLGMHPLMGQMPYGPGGVPNYGMGPGQGNWYQQSFGPPGSKQAIANMIYQQALSRGYNSHEAMSIVAYAIGESGLDPGISGGPQGGAGAENEVVGLFQQKPDFARGGGIDPSMRTDPMANTWAYLNQLEKFRHLPIEQALPKTSVGGPLASGKGAAPQAWGPLMDQAAELLGLGRSGFTADPFGVRPSTGTGSNWLGNTGGPNPAVDFPGAGAGATLGGTAAPNQPVGKSPGTGGWQPGGGGGFGVGGGAMAAAASAGGMALDMMAPGAGQAAQTAMQLIQRTISYAGQLGAIGISGLMETFGLSDSVLGDPSKSWLGRVVAGFAQAKPAVPTSAGQTQAPVQPQQHVGSGQPPGPQGPTVNIESFVQAPNRNGQQTAQDLAFNAYASWGKK